MRIVDLGGGAVAFELDEAADSVGSLDPLELRKEGWSDQAIRNYEQYRDGSSFLKRARTLIPTPGEFSIPTPGKFSEE